MTFEAKNLKQRLDGISKVINTGTIKPIQEILPLDTRKQRQIKIRTLKAIRGLCDDIIKGIDKADEKLGEIDKRLTGQTHGSQALEKRSRKELYAIAQDLDINGRSTMSKDDLIEAIRESW